MDNFHSVLVHRVFAVSGFGPGQWRSPLPIPLTENMQANFGSTGYDKPSTGEKRVPNGDETPDPRDVNNPLRVKRGCPMEVGPA